MESNRKSGKMRFMEHPLIGKYVRVFIDRKDERCLNSLHNEYMYAYKVEYICDSHIVFSTFGEGSPKSLCLIPFSRIKELDTSGINTETGEADSSCCVALMIKNNEK